MTFETLSTNSSYIMGKQELKRKETAVVSPNGEGKQYEQTLTVDDTCLPSAEELTAYQEIDPNIVTFLMDVSKKEQEHRHKMERDKLRVVDKNERRVFRLNWWGMFYAFLSIVVLVGLSGYALYLDKPWFAGILGAGTFVSIVYIFVKNDKTDSTKK